MAVAPTNYDETVALLRDDKVVQLAGIDVDGILRGKIMAKDKFLSSVKGSGFGFCSVVFGWDMHDKTYAKESAISNLGNGYRDLTARIDLNTYRRCPAASPGAPELPFFLVTFIDPETDEILSVCPRGLLQTVVARLADNGLTAYAGAEYEFFNYKETSQSANSKGFANLTPLTDGMYGYSIARPNLNPEYFYGVQDACAAFDIPLEAFHTETGPGVYETALAYQEVIRMADNATLFKHMAKTVGSLHGIMPTFMAKPYNNLPGCSGHVHISLRDASGENIFAVPQDQMQAGRPGALYKDTARISERAEWFLAGVLKGLPSIMPCLCPTINSYKRLVENFWAPIRVSYAYENRVASVRIISPPLAASSATRLEIRVPGADMHPHLTFAAVLACGLYGIQNKLALAIPPLDTTTPEALAGLERLPKTLQEATAKMNEADSLARQVLGNAFIDHFVASRENEWDLFSQAVTDFEAKRYTEMI